MFNYAIEVLYSINYPIIEITRSWVSIKGHSILFTDTWKIQGVSKNSAHFVFWNFSASEKHVE
jgi:hypothetical protein